MDYAAVPWEPSRTGPSTGKLNDTQFGRRMTGTGVLADQINQTFNTFIRHGLRVSRRGCFENYCTRWNTASEPRSGAAAYRGSNARLVTRREKNSFAPSGAFEIFNDAAISGLNTLGYSLTPLDGARSRARFTTPSSKTMPSLRCVRQVGLCF
jgi:hypothetical protein